MAVKAIMFEIVWPFYVKGVFYILFSKISTFPELFDILLKRKKFEINFGKARMLVHFINFPSNLNNH